MGAERENVLRPGQGCPRVSYYLRSQDVFQLKYIIYIHLLPYSIIFYTPQDISLDLQAFLGLSCYKNKPKVSTVGGSLI